MLSEKQKRAPHPAQSWLLISLTALFLPTPLAAGESRLAKLQSYEDSIVTVRAQVFAAKGGNEKPRAALSPSGEIVILDSQRVGMLEKTGAGVIVDANGTIVTNTHVIFGSQLIKVVLWDKNEIPATVLFVSPQYDFSLIKIEAGQPLSAVEWGDPDGVTLGQEIVTIGHSPLLDRTISGGRIVGLGTRTLDDGRVIPELMELNINHYSGDSGGPVFDLDGKFLGLVNAKRTAVDRSCFAIPADKIHSAYLNLADEQKKQ